MVARDMLRFLRPMLWLACCWLASGVGNNALAQSRLAQTREFQRGFLLGYDETEGSASAVQPAAHHYPSELSESGTIDSLPSQLFREGPPLLTEDPLLSYEYDPLESYQLPELPRTGPPVKSGVVQKFSFGSTWIPSLDPSNDYSTTSFEFHAVLGFPAPTIDSPLLLKPSFEMHLLQAPIGIDLPEQVYNESLQIRWLSKLSDRWGVDLAVTPGIHGDFEKIDSDSFRITAHALASYDMTPNLKLVGGLLYLDSNAYNFVPVGGWIWEPNDNTRWEILMPRPRMARRYFYNYQVEKWWYIAGELGSNQWAIRYPNGLGDQLSMQDIKAMIGIERTDLTGTSFNSRLEFGYVFERKLEFSSRLPDIRGDDALMLRASIWY